MNYIIVEHPNGGYTLGARRLQEAVQPFGIEIKKQMALAILNFLNTHSDLAIKFVDLLNDPHRLFVYVTLIIGLLSGGGSHIITLLRTV